MRIPAPLAGLHIVFVLVTACSAGASPDTSLSSSSRQSIIIGFVGGFVRHDEVHHPEVQLAARLRDTYNDMVTVKIFENRHKEAARRAISLFLDRNQDGLLSDEEKQNARVILFGHSWGASAAIALAGDLQRDNIPVLLTVQVDSIAKIGQNDGVIPANVARAINFYQPHGLFHGRRKIIAADPSHTQVLADVQLEYRNQPLQCRNFPWYDRFLFRDHLKIECDAQVWSQVEALIAQELTTRSLPRVRASHLLESTQSAKQPD
jgi:hypothetical protein